MFEALAKLAEKTRTSEKYGQPWATRATGTGKLHKTATFEETGPVAQGWENGQPEQPGTPKWATAKPAENRHYSGVVAQVAQVAHENDKRVREAGASAWNAMDWREWIAERAAILEFDAGLPQGEADLQAYQHTLVEWQNCNPPIADPHVCAGCGRPINKAATDWRPLADGATVHYGGARGLRCWERHGARRRAEAEAALAEMGVTPWAGTQGA